ncbi:uncharacterized protein LOC132886813 [Neoarius graeffei]|uniref:uncharacterized protein LOC132870070 n=1 Tax=Neoarius graeffei TaxID=443677 RepID=UPI00298CE3CE|nr:uncharacterized protein LOC132870070 [Neoarius graeffei]XP_060777912.1 uncharacterized protein LOC132886813 [Neoarius graeffei]
MSLDQYSDFIKHRRLSGMACADIAAALTGHFGSLRGFSERNVRRWCKEQGLGAKDFCPDRQLESEVAKAIEETGSYYGRKMMTGYLAAKGVKASEGRVGKVLQTVNPPYHAARQQGARNLNPVPYNAEYVGHKLHIDQNEKLVMFGVTHVMAIDGYSKKIVGHSTMPIKNNIIIYDEVYRPAVMSYGIWDQVRVDCGREFFLILFVQEKLAAYRHNKERQPYLQTPSTRNHTIERMWLEVNQRVNFPLKTALVQMCDQEEICLDDSLTKFCTSNLTCHISRIGLTNFVKAWNAHRIPGKGIPNLLCGQGCPAKVLEDNLPIGEIAADLYQQEVGTALTREAVFGTDPFSNEEARRNAESEFASHFDPLSLLHSAVNNNFSPFQNALRCLIDITRQHAA